MSLSTQRPRAHTVEAVERVGKRGIAARAGGSQAAPPLSALPAPPTSAPRWGCSSHPHPRRPQLPRSSSSAPLPPHLPCRGAQSAHLVTTGSSRAPGSNRCVSAPRFACSARLCLCLPLLISPSFSGSVGSPPVLRSTGPCLASRLVARRGGGPGRGRNDRRLH